MKRIIANKHENFWGMLFISPWIIGLLAFTLMPIIASFVFTFYHIDLTNISTVKYVGFENWIRMFQDENVPHAIYYTLIFSAFNLPVCIAFSFFLAILLNSKNLLGSNLFQTLFYLPTMIPLIASIMIWRGVLNEQTGWIDIFLEKALRFVDPDGSTHASGAGGLRWFFNKRLVYFAYTMIDMWGIGTYFMIFISGLQRVPISLYEASYIEGAGWWTRLIKITIPQISPIILFNMVIYLITVLQYFITPQVITNGDGTPEGMTMFVNIYFYKQGFVFFNMGYGAVQAWVIFAVTSLFVYLAFKFSKKHVYYAGER